MITLTSDFGERDSYVAQMKGRILSINPCADIIDLSHQISPYNIMEGGIFLAQSTSQFPEESIHVAVVDPTVGSGRFSIALKAGNRYFIGPDNGLFSLVLSLAPLQACHELTNPDFFPREKQSTFHGRDYFAPAAAYLSRGIAIEELGPPIDSLIPLEYPSIKISDQSIEGQILYEDHFGNLVSNIPSSILKDKKGITAWAGTEPIPFFRTFSQVPLHTATLLPGSGTGRVELVINQGRASDFFSTDTPLSLQWEV